MASGTWRASRTARRNPKPSLVETGGGASTASVVRVSFRLASRGHVRFVVTQIAPVCRRVGSMALAGRKGRNGIALSAHVGNRRLTDGTYRIDAQRGSEALFAVLVSVDHGRIVRPRIVAPALSDPCATGLVPGAGGPIALAARPTALASARLSGAPESVKRTAAPKQREAAALGAAFTKTSADPANLIRLFVLCAVGLAIALLGAAAVPDAAVPTSALGALLVRRRIEVALAGAWTLLVAVVSYLLSMH